MTFTIELDSPGWVRDIAIKYAKVAKAMGNDEDYEFFNILRERTEEAAYGMQIAEIEKEEVEDELPVVTIWKGVPQYPGIEVNLTGAVRDRETHAVLDPFGPDERCVRIENRDGVMCTVVTAWLLEKAHGVRITGKWFMHNGGL